MEKRRNKFDFIASEKAKDFLIRKATFIFYSFTLLVIILMGIGRGKKETNTLSNFEPYHKSSERKKAELSQRV